MTWGEETGSICSNKFGIKGTAKNPLYTSPLYKFLEKNKLKMAQYTFNVEMSCSGCSNAVNKALSRLEGVEKVDISLEKQEVVVDTELPRETVLAAIKKTGKTVKE
ncbi:unnamed protein product [Mucor circinelloides]